MPAPAISISDALRSARETRALEIGHGIINRTAAMFREQFGNKTPLVVTDSITLAIAGKAVLASFGDAPAHKPFVYTDPSLYAEFAFVAQLENVLKTSDAIPVAVGSGTINDLTKLASHRTNRPYMCVATAASMDGYTAFGASITHRGSKQTFVCPAPQAVLADLDVVKGAPKEMNASGYADLLAKTTAGADWMLADALGVEPIQPEAWRIVQSGLREMLSRPEGIPSADPQAISRLTEGLMLAGFGMQSAQTSRAASGAEHQFSHLWDMQHHTHNGAAPSHGFKVGVATMATSALFESLLDYPIEQIDLDECCGAMPSDSARETLVRKLFPEGDLRTVALQESKAKAITPENVRLQLELLHKSWPDLKQKLRQQLLGFDEVKRMLRLAGAAYEPEQIGISRERLRDSFLQASLIRRRFTILDVVSRANLLENFLDQIFGPQGRWPVKAARTETLAEHS